MKAVLQRVSQASVSVDSRIVGQIGKGVLVFLAVGKEDSEADADYLVKKLIQLRMFEDKEGNLNLSPQEVGAAFLVISQFTLYGDCRKGRRPSFDRAADPQKAEKLYDFFIEQLKKQGMNVASGQFRAMMNVQLVNEGPVTLIVESRPR
ncbi:MAG TPA: D-aminoacyl-tRNA deacylase [Candidatus Omnitrophota bacterium]|nr:D-aminoacyl-tRNA deacylase [Candidatus Omnitrophota bacterium]